MCEGAVAVGVCVNDWLIGHRSPTVLAQACRLQLQLKRKLMGCGSGVVSTTTEPFIIQRPNVQRALKATPSIRVTLGDRPRD